MFIGSIMLSNQKFFPVIDNEHTAVLGSYLDIGLSNTKSKYTDNFIGEYFVRLREGTQSSIYLAFIVLILVLWLLNILLSFMFNYCIIC